MRRLTENLSWKLLSLAAAIGLWYGVAGETQVATSLPVVVQYKNAPADLDITGEHPERIFLEVRGPASRLSTAALAGTALVLDLGNVHSPGEQTFTIGDRDLGLPAGVALIRAVPSQVHLSFEKKSSRMIPVRVRYSAGPPPGYRISSQLVTPESIRVTGPEQHLQRLKFAFTDPIDLHASISAAEFRVPVFLDDPHLRPEPATPVSVSVSVEKIP